MTTAKRNAYGAVLVVAVGLAAAALMMSRQKPRAPQPLPPNAVKFADVPSTPAEVDALRFVPGEGAPNFGYVPDPRGTRAFLQSLEHPSLRDAAPHLFEDDDAEPKQETGEGDDNATGPPTADEPVLLYRALFEAYAATHNGAQWRVGKQGIGDCVSWGWAHGADVLLAVQFKLQQSGEWRPAATEAIYGGSRCEARGRSYAGFGDGSYGGAAAKWVNKWGVLFRQPYPFEDLSTYSADRAKQWGAYGCGGRGQGAEAADVEARLHPVRAVAVVESFDEAVAAIRSGYPVPVCSGQGFSSRRDDEGFCRPSGSWSHCMVFIGCRFDRPGLLCLNSWGPSWVSGPKWPDDQPDGSFWVDARTATGMLDGGDSFAMSDELGFPRRKLRHNEGW